MRRLYIRRLARRHLSQDMIDVMRDAIRSEGTASREVIIDELAANIDEMITYDLIVEAFHGRGHDVTAIVEWIEEQDQVWIRQLIAHVWDMLADAWAAEMPPEKMPGHAGKVVDELTRAGKAAVRRSDALSWPDPR